MAEQKKDERSLKRGRRTYTIRGISHQEQKGNHRCYFGYNHHYSRYSNVQEPLCGTS